MELILSPCQKGRCQDCSGFEYYDIATGKRNRAGRGMRFCTHDCHKVVAHTA